MALQFEEYFAGSRRVFDLDVDLTEMTPFQRTVLEAVMAVPWGEVRSYRDIAEAIGNPLAARAVGGALAACPASIVIPCHRIIKSDGSAGQYGLQPEGNRGTTKKLLLLALEGVAPGKGLAK